MKHEDFQYDATSESYSATWDDCVLTGNHVGYDDHQQLMGEVRATLPSGNLLNHKRLKLLDTWACQEFAKECDARPEAQMKMRQYLTQFGDWVKRRHAEILTASNGVPPDLLRSARHTPPPLVPPLPASAELHPELAEGAAPWLDAYCEYSQKWAPRAASGFHEAVGLWVLSTVAARRVCVAFGKAIFPVLFINLAAESTIYTKSTAVTQGETLLRHAGLDFLLSPNHTTPQALIRSMHGRVSTEYETLEEEEKERLHKRLAFSGQRGWYYAEWGGMLQQMHRSDSPMAMFHELLRRLDDDEPDFSSETIQRGLEFVAHPYLSLLTSSTPHDLAPFMTQGGRWWHDGFWPRFAFIVPDGPPVTTRRPQGRGVPPSALVAALHTWHTSLGMPTIEVESVRDKHDRATGDFRIHRGEFPCQTLTVEQDAEDAYNAYGDAMWTQDIPRDLIPSYARLPDKALRIATLLASLQAQTTVKLCHWTRAQHIAEGWRAMLHRVLTMMGETGHVSKDAQSEEQIEMFLAQEGPQSMRGIQRRTHLDSATLKRLVQGMEFTGRVGSRKHGRSVYVFVPQDEDVPTHEDEKEEQNDIPF